MFQHTISIEGVCVHCGRVIPMVTDPRPQVVNGSYQLVFERCSCSQPVQKEDTRVPLQISQVKEIPQLASIEWTWVCVCGEEQTIQDVPTKRHIPKDLLPNEMLCRKCYRKFARTNEFSGQLYKKM